jgi:hypothetical protein
VTFESYSDNRDGHLLCKKGMVDDREGNETLGVCMENQQNIGSVKVI